MFPPPVTPRFGDVQITGAQWQKNTTEPSAVSAYWSTSNWMSGANNSPDPKQYASSFGCLDAVVRNVVNRDIFPKVSFVVVSGFSAGGQTVQRYSWATAVDSNAAASNWQMRFITSNPSSYAYLNGSRPDRSCYPLKNTGATHTCSSFVYNTTDFNCSTYNDWKWGLDNIPDSGYLYLSPLSNLTLQAAQTELMRLKDTRYIFGTYDYCNCNLANFVNEDNCYHDQYTCTPDDYGGDHCCDSFPDSTVDNAIADDDASNLQGSNRLQRGLIFMSYLEWFWSSYDYKPQYTFVPQMGHNATQFYFSSQFAQWAFQVGPSFGSVNGPVIDQRPPMLSV
jgi:hypothetical protein